MGTISCRGRDLMKRIAIFLSLLIMFLEPGFAETRLGVNAGYVFTPAILPKLENEFGIIPMPSGGINISLNGLSYADIKESEHFILGLDYGLSVYSFPFGTVDDDFSFFTPREQWGGKFGITGGYKIIPQKIMLELSLGLNAMTQIIKFYDGDINSALLYGLYADACISFRLNHFGIELGCGGDIFFISSATLHKFDRQTEFGTAALYAFLGVFYHF